MCDVRVHIETVMYTQMWQKGENCATLIPANVCVKPQVNKATFWCQIQVFLHFWCWFSWSDRCPKWGWMHPLAPILCACFLPQIDVHEHFKGNMRITWPYFLLLMFQKICLKCTEDFSSNYIFNIPSKTNNRAQISLSAGHSN